MKKLIKLTLVVAMSLSSMSLYAQKLARVNSQEVILVMPEFKQMQDNLELFGKDLADQLEQIQVEFNNKYAEFQKNQATMAASVKQMKQQELEQLQTRYMEFQRVSQEDYQKEQFKLLEPIQKKLQEAIKKVSKTGGYAVVFDTAAQSLAYYDENQVVDIQPAVRTELGIAADAQPYTGPAAAPVQ